MDYINFLKSGSGIHIKKANKGKFTDYCGGKVTSECIARGKKSPSATIRKRATFAANARKWKHNDGGIMKASLGDMIVYSSAKDRERLKKLFARDNEFPEIENPFNHEQQSSQSNSTQGTVTYEDLVASLDLSQPSTSTTTSQTGSTPVISTNTESNNLPKSGPRGYRNNNPLNIRISNNAWKGKLQNNTDGSFEQFTDIAHGYRAGFINMRTQINRGNNTIRKLINIWAPASDNNNPENYARFVSTTSGIPIDAVIDPNDSTSMQKIVSAMARMENGKDANAEDIAQGWKLYTGIA